MRRFPDAVRRKRPVVVKELANPPRQSTTALVSVCATFWPDIKSNKCNNLHIIPDLHRANSFFFFTSKMKFDLKGRRLDDVENTQYEIRRSNLFRYQKGIPQDTSGMCRTVATSNKGGIIYEQR